jgi:hypothetical protein
MRVYRNTEVPKKASNGGLRGSMGVYWCIRHLTTNGEGRRFESCRAHYKLPAIKVFYTLMLSLRFKAVPLV